jgi:hypothetical protein
MVFDKLTPSIRTCPRRQHIVAGLKPCARGASRQVPAEAGTLPALCKQDYSGSDAASSEGRNPLRGSEGFGVPEGLHSPPKARSEG